ncbi:AraC family transcriptional regulator [Devosia sediminis]|uniref:Helix-turn-helix transcriptional regulator n=1 Tax=Devosia sediminis TaxID=2798801 RepID=A0A934MIZ1_9HYPH|nr:AraC family transcriptional regulator [Devosia sediminis]MBJ3783498.1 helix-turn-helix transcriptional regulator [Devosia sediminis]
MEEWLFSSGGCSRPHHFENSERLRFRHGATRAYLEEVQVLPGIWLYRGEASAHCRFQIDVAGGDRQGRVVLGGVLSSRGLLKLEGCDDMVWRDDGRFYALSPIERHCRYEIDAERGWRSVAVRIEAEAMDFLGADDTLPDIVSDVLLARRDDLADMGTLPGGIRRLSQSLLRSPFEGPIGRLFLQARVLELLGHQFQHLGGGSQSRTLTSREQSRIRMARDMLMADLRDPPDLEALASMAGLSSKKLNRGFRDLYGTTVFSYLQDARLDVARAALEAGTPMPLKQLAWDLGYGQVSNFVTAFRRRFGVTPGSLRQGRPPA